MFDSFQAIILNAGHRLERDVETGVLTTRHARKAVALQKNSPTDVSTVDFCSTEIINNGHLSGRAGGYNFVSNFFFKLKLFTYLRFE